MVMVAGLTGSPYGGREAGTSTVGAWEMGEFVTTSVGPRVTFAMDGMSVSSAAPITIGDPAASIVGSLLGDTVTIVTIGAFVGNRDGDKVIGAIDGVEDVGKRVGNLAGLDVGLDDEERPALGADNDDDDDDATAPAPAWRHGATASHASFHTALLSLFGSGRKCGRVQ